MGAHYTRFQSWWLSQVLVPENSMLSFDSCFDNLDKADLCLSVFPWWYLKTTRAASDTKGLNLPFCPSNQHSSMAIDVPGEIEKRGSP